MVIGIAHILSNVNIPSFMKDNVGDILGTTTEMCRRSIRIRETNGVDKEEEGSVEIDGATGLLGDFSDSDDDEASFDPDEDADLESKQYYTSPVESIDEVKYLQQAINSLPPEVSQAYLGKMDKKDFEDLQTAFNFVN